MSLIGSLEDLNLGDILQIIYLSQKSGVLVIRTEGSQGRIIFREGLACGGHVSGGPTDLRGLLVGGGYVDENPFDRIAEECESEGWDLESELAKHELISPERIDSLRLAGQRGHDADFELLFANHGLQRMNAEVLAHVVTRLANDAVPTPPTATINAHKAEPNLLCFATEVVTGELAV